MNEELNNSSTTHYIYLLSVVTSYVGQLGFFSHAQTLVASDDGVYK